MDLLALASLLLVLAAGFGAVNALVLRLPSAIGILVVALAASFAIMVLDILLPGLGVAGEVRTVVLEFEFSETLLEGMLGLLLFAGALHVKLADLKREWPLVLLMATIGVALSTAIAGVGFSWITGAPLLIALVFGALISPTDPVAVLGVLRAAKLPKTLETKIAGESLFNDGVGYVVFLVLVGLAYPAGDDHGRGLSGAATLFAQEAFGGAALGAALGFVAFRVMRRIDDPPIEVLITLALAFGGYQLSLWLHVSAPIMAVVAGLLIGDVGTKYGMSKATRAHVDTFWTLIDEILNAVLFLLIGVEVFAVAFDASYLLAGLAAILLHLLARFAAVIVPVTLLRPFGRDFEAGLTRIMTWGGLKGGISVALVLSLPEGEWTPVMLTATYMVVLFSIIVQGLTVAPLAARLNGTGS
ncbi:cation:proton antiporter [Jannaschia ovalis]|uniref:Sodium:proton antiporter n=1 Tax=Jannaschia ovalis TaxID=3038773 RepID=A0ABY8LB05_9RHOB|nr:sodium:proton antiporter [Jannaschia sp. GRR-S6-38]WGH78469.1 sodium:proton antiporter [Jannaschia sp. GRR-S6-38]